MKCVFNGKRYDSEKMVILGERDYYSYSNTYAGTGRLLIASDGQCFWKVNANGQDCHITSSFDPVNPKEYLDGLVMTDTEAAIAISRGLIEEVP